MSGGSKLDDLYYGVGAWCLEKDVRLTEPDRFWTLLKPYIRRECALTFLPEAEADVQEEIHRTFAGANKFNQGGPATDVRLRDLLCKVVGFGTPLRAVPKSMLQNQVLVKPSVGKAKRSTRSIPGEEFSFGMPVIKTDGGTVGAMKWDVAQKRDLTEKRESKLKDYSKLNKQMVHSGVVSPADANRFMISHDVRRRLPQVRKKAVKRENPAKGFGMGNRPSTPIEKVVRNEFELEWLVNSSTSPSGKAATQQQQARRKPQASHTTASRLREEMNRANKEEVENAAGGGSPKNLFKMRKFANVGPKVSSHRRPSAPPSPTKGGGSPLPQEQQGRPGASALSRDGGGGGGGGGSEAGGAPQEEAWQ